MCVVRRGITDRVLELQYVILFLRSVIHETVLLPDGEMKI